MIVSHEHRFIFVKTHKTASTSVEVLLSPLAGPDAVVTPILESAPGHEPRNWRRAFNPIPELRARPDLARSTLAQARRRTAFYNHIPAWRARRRLGARWDRYHTFTIERDPWDKVTSYYFWRTRDQTPRPSLDDWLTEALQSRQPLSDWGLYTEGDRFAVDHVGRYEDLAGELGRLFDQLGLDASAPLPSFKSHHRERRTLDFSPRAVDLVHEHFAREFEAFGYPLTPPEPGRPD
jgi:hypothetical protein